MGDPPLESIVSMLSPEALTTAVDAAGPTKYAETCLLVCNVILASF